MNVAGRDDGALAPSEPAMAPLAPEPLRDTEPAPGRDCGAGGSTASASAAPAAAAGPSAPSLAGAGGSSLPWSEFDDGFLRAGAGGAAPGPARSPDDDPLIGAEVGGVRIGRLIAVGGMGRVYEGRQRRPDRPVAVKCMRPGLVAATHLRRFEFEAELLARLRHPGIAAIHAAGTHLFEGREIPYFVMELIPGARPLTAHAAAAGLGVRQRLELFRLACDAVAHGHRLGVIHRDLKPGNILVDADGRVKVIDFGVACTTGADVALATAERDVGRFVGTLQYMSPEQCAGNPAALDVRSDVYALGVVLYELLAGRPLHDLRGVPFLEALAIVRATPAPPLPSALRGVGGQAAAIVATCLEKDRERRYGSAGELALDLGRHLAGEAIVARPPGLVDALARLARRHRAAAAAAAGILLALVAAVIGISAFALRAERERAAAVAASRRADAEADTARRRLYVANLYRIAELVQAGSLGSARTLFAETAPLAVRGKSNPAPFSTSATPENAEGFRSWQSPHPAAGDLFHGLPFRAGPAPAGEAAEGPPLEQRILAADLDGAILAVPAGGPVRVIRLSPDGRIVAAGGDDGRVRLWTLADLLAKGTAAVPRLLGGSGAAIRRLGFAADSSRLAAADAERVVRVWDLADPAAAAPVVTVSGHASEIKTVGFSPDGTALLTSSQDGAVILWDSATGGRLEAVPAEGERVSVMRPDPACARVATGSRDGQVRIHDIADGGQPIVLAGHTGPISALAWSPDGGLVATASSDGTTRIHDAATGAQRHRLAGHSGPVRAVVFSPDGRLVATGGDDATLHTSDAASGELRGSVRLDSRPVGLRFSHDGRRLLATTENLAAVIWDLDRDLTVALRGHSEPLSGAEFSLDGTLVVTASHDGTVRLWDAARDGRLPTLDAPPAKQWRVAFSPDGGLVAATGNDGTTRVWDAASGLERRRFASEPAGIPRGLAFAPDSRQLTVALGDEVPRAEVWDLETAARVATVARGHQIPKTGTVVSPAGTRLISWLQDKGASTAASDDPGLATALLWEVGGGRIATLAGHGQFIAATCFSPDGTRAATASYDGTARLWDALTGRAGHVLRGHEGWVTIVDFTPDGRRLVTSSRDGTTCVWDAIAGGMVHRLDMKPGRVLIHAVSPAGDLVAAVGEDRTTTVWDLATGARLATFTSHAHQVVALAFSADGTRLATGSTDGTVRLWNPATGEELVTLRHGQPVADLAFCPRGTCLAVAVRDSGSIRLWGRSRADFAAARRHAAGPPAP